MMQIDNDVETLRRELGAALRRNLHIVAVARALNVDVAAIESFVSDRCRLAPHLLRQLPALLWPKPEQVAEVLNENSSKPRPKPTERAMLSAKSLKATMVLVPAEVAALRVPPTSRVVLIVDIAGHQVSADIASKALRKAQATIAQFGVDGVSALIQGKLVGSSVVEAGLVVQPKAPKPAERTVAANGPRP